MAGDGSGRLSVRRLGLEILAVSAGLVIAWAVTSSLWVAFGTLPMVVSGSSVALIGVIIFRRRLYGLGTGLVAGALVCGAVFVMLSFLMPAAGVD
ncbi:MAG: hypothetical protein AB1673_06530 [Actinomycetota bacterium]